MDKPERLAERFEEHRTHLRAVAHRMLGSFSEADDAIQEARWRLSRSEAGVIENLASAAVSTPLLLSESVGLKRQPRTSRTTSSRR